MNFSPSLFSIGFAVAVAGFVGVIQPSAAKENELYTLGLPLGPGAEEVEVYCSACHSLRTVAQQGLKRSDWDELLEWMVDEQEMDPLDDTDRQLVLDYLARNVNAEARRERRKSGGTPGARQIPAAGE